jgi:hypothetical protein
MKRSQVRDWSAALNVITRQGRTATTNDNGNEQRFFPYNTFLQSEIDGVGLGGVGLYPR